jgi:hypothetical protein
MASQQWRRMYASWKVKHPKVREKKRAAWVRGCLDKYSHPNFLSALLHANALVAKGGPQGKVLNMYICPICNGIHVGWGRPRGQYMFEQDFRFEWGELAER